MAEPHPRLSALQLLAALPFVVFLFILPFPGTVALRLICLIAAVAVALASWRRLAQVPLRWPILLWVAVVLGSLPTAVDPGYSWREIKNEVGYTLAAFLAFFVWTRDRARLGAACLGLAAGFVVIGGAAAFDEARIGAWSSTGFYGGAGSISAYLAAAAPVLLLAGALWFPGRALAWAGGAALVLLLVVALNSQRVLWPVMLLQVALVGLWLRRNAASSPAALRGPRLALGGLLVFVVLAVGFHSNYQRRVGAELDKDPRPAVWTAVGERILEKPLVGAGFGRRAMSKAYPELVPADAPLMWHAHNLVLNYGISAGIPGMAAILLLFGAFGGTFWRLARVGEARDRLVALAGAAMVLGVFARNMVNDFFVRDGALLFWAMAGMLLGYLLRPPADGARA